jgi:hypothetical protein
MAAKGFITLASACESLPWTNTQAYSASSEVAKEKSFITLTPGCQCYKTFSFITDDKA